MNLLSHWLTLAMLGEDGGISFLELILRFVAWVLLWLAPLSLLFMLAYFILSLPLRRQERARLFLDLLETGFQRGQSAERTVMSVAESRDLSPGVRFYLLAAHLENGLRLGTALERVPRLLPPQIVAMLKVGEEIGDPARVLPACRALLNDGVSQTRSAENYLPAFMLVITPLTFVVISMLNVYILPKFQEIAAAMEATPSAYSLLVLHFGWWFAGIILMMFLIFCVATAFYVGGPRFVSWLELGFGPVSDWIFYRLPWRRKRMHRDFSAMLALLLDAEVPEARAVTLAAESTANGILIRRAKAVVEDLQRGAKLTDALRHLDDAGEFKWRLANACQTPGRFWSALAGWREALDAQAFQQEQAAAQVITTLFVVFNGLIVGIIVTGVFSILIGIINAAVLW